MINDSIGSVAGRFLFKQHVPSPNEPCPLASSSLRSKLAGKTQMFLSGKPPEVKMKKRKMRREKLKATRKRNKIWYRL